MDRESVPFFAVRTLFREMICDTLSSDSGLQLKLSRAQGKDPSLIMCRVRAPMVSGSRQAGGQAGGQIGRQNESRIKTRLLLSFNLSFIVEMAAYLCHERLSWNKKRIGWATHCSSETK